MTTHFRIGGRSLGEALGQLRRRLGFLTYAELELEYLHGSKSLLDLEMRMREFDRRPRQAPSHLYGYQARG